ncbi:hypothetical protein MWU58_09425 [Flavobacteriaceae bacterium S0825]|uniref:hypothetical protein n=1 Tax=Gaetbulibacter sp. S0825 TaxID=2720084 RepID=UPI0014300AA3|nr:hypothetical protein [Gaetbulibacter sp. S0825]MCK0109513.1 hypothetical protein [Flavobacteriaceae bacterium S0825]NIX65148.1 hypothetical protein [Gaetbulibacter sp. S0825]
MIKKTTFEQAISKYRLLLIVIISFNYAYSQKEYLVRQSGEQIEFVNKNIRKDTVVLKINGSKNKLKIPAKEVKGYYLSNSNEFYYLKRSTDTLMGNSYQYFVRLKEGHLKVYSPLWSRLPPNAIGGGQVKNEGIKYTSMYIEKDDVLRHVWFIGSILPKKKEKKKNFESIISSDSLSLSTFKKENYKHDAESIFNIIEDYNLRHYNKRYEGEVELAKVIFYREKRKQHKSNVNIILDQQEYSLGLNDVIEVNLPVDSDSKICFSIDGSDKCYLLRASSFFDECYEVDINKTGIISIKRRNRYSDYLKVRLKYFGMKNPKSN